MGSQHNSFELLSAVAAAAAAVGTASVANFMAFTNTITLTQPSQDCGLCVGFFFLCFGISCAVTFATAGLSSEL